MSDIDVAALRAAAEAATPGPWEWDGTWGVDRRESPTSVTGVVYEADVDDAAYIAAANPAVVLALLDRLAAAEAAVEEVRQAFDPGELDCGRIGMTCRDVHTPDRWCRACRITNALDPKEQP